MKGKMFKNGLGFAGMEWNAKKKNCNTGGETHLLRQPKPRTKPKIDTVIQK
jgi:hypothetical protein